MQDGKSLVAGGPEPANKALIPEPSLEGHEETEDGQNDDAYQASSLGQAASGSPKPKKTATGQEGDFVNTKLETGVQVDNTGSLGMSRPYFIRPFPFLIVHPLLFSAQ